MSRTCTPECPNCGQLMEDLEFEKVACDFCGTEIKKGSNYIRIEEKISFLVREDDDPNIDQIIDEESELDFCSSSCLADYTQSRLPQKKKKSEQKPTKKKEKKKEKKSK